MNDGHLATGQKRRGRNCHQGHTQVMLQMQQTETRGELSYFAATLTAFLQESHPTMSSNADFIQDRSDAATDAYVDATLLGANHFAALEQANAVLYRDLRFSKFDTVRRIVAD